MGSVHKDPNVFHFSHPHPLECTTSTPTGNVSCFGCKLKVKHGEDYYQCKACAFSLHHVCYNMPLITNHPSHPNHDLVLLVTPSLPSTTLNCVACAHHVTGFFYHCSECSIFFHSFCLALPVSLAITYHPHEIKLEFSPPYDFFCDLCNEPSYNGWLYRCSNCEFDTHIACAVENVDPHLFQSSPWPLLRQLTSHQVEHKAFNNASSAGDDYEIMRLMAQQIGRDKRLYSSARKKHWKIVELELQETEPSPAEFLSKLEERTPFRDKSTPLSDHSSSPLSNQYSDSYFSIDLAKSYSAHERRTHQVRREGGIDYITRAVTMPERVVSNYGQREEPVGLVNWPCNDSYDAAQRDKLNAAFFIKEGSTSDFGKSVVKNPNESYANSEPEGYSCSGWRKFLCCL